MRTLLILNDYYVRTCTIDPLMTWFGDVSVTNCDNSDFHYFGRYSNFILLLAEPPFHTEKIIRSHIPPITTPIQSIPPNFVTKLSLHHKSTWCCMFSCTCAITPKSFNITNNQPRSTTKYIPLNPLQHFEYSPNYDREGVITTTL